MGFAELRARVPPMANYRFPVIMLRSEQSLELVLPTGGGGGGYVAPAHGPGGGRGAHDALRCHARASVDRQPSWWQVLRALAVAMAVSQVLQQPIDTWCDICRRRNVDPE